MQTITFYSYKGGTGRSLAVANAARYLSNLGFGVVALDFDLEAPGLHYKFAVNLGGKPLEVKAGLVDYLNEFLVEGQPPKSLSGFSIDVPALGRAGPLIRLIPAGRGPLKEYWTKLARINWHDLLYSQEARGVQLFLDLKKRIAKTLTPDYLLVDSRTGITEMSGIATSLLADRVICLVLPSAENLEGARVVLRSVRRSRREFGCPDVEITIALSRRPEEADSEFEKMEVKQIREFMNEEAEDLEDTLSCSEVFVLHSESALEREESLRVGTVITPDESVLLRDYLRLFASFVPQELIARKVKSLTERAKELIWTDPDAAVREVEELAEAFNHPECHRTLLQFYAVRGIRGERALRKAERLWELSRDSSDLAVWEVLAASYGPRPIHLKDKDRVWTPSLEFVSAVWRGAGKQDANFALKLAFGYASEDRHAKAGDVLLEAIDANGPSASLVAQCIEHLGRAQRKTEAIELVGNLGPQFSKDSDFVANWADFAIRYDDEQSIAYLAQPAMQPVLWGVDPVVAGLVYARAGDISSARSRAIEVLNQLKTESGLYRKWNPHLLGELFGAVDMLDAFRDLATRLKVPSDVIRRVEKRATG